MTDTPNYDRLAAELEDHPNHVHRLANLADCASPDSPTSAGAVFLSAVALGAAEAFDYAPEYDLHDAAHEVADAAVPVYTQPIWESFVDLAAYMEDDESESMAHFAGEGKMTSAAAVALYQIAYRLAVALFEEFAEADEDE